MLAKTSGPPRPTLATGDNAMNTMVELQEHEIQMVAGGGTVGPITVQTNVAPTTQVAIGLAVLSPNARVNANNNAFTLQLNFAATV